MRALPFLATIACLLPVGLTQAVGQAPTPAATATCKDGTTITSTVRSGACSRHGGVQSWALPTCTAPDKVVWVNTDSQVYFPAGDRWFGKTVKGKYFCQKAADAEGDHAAK